MKSFFILFLFACATITNTSLNAQPDAEAPIRREIERQYAQYIKAFGEADAASVANLYDENGARLSKGSKILGREAIRADLESWLKKVGPVQVTVDIAALWVVDDVVYETGKWSYTYKPPGQDERTIGGRYFTIWKRQKDKSWKMSIDSGLPD